MSPTNNTGNTIKTKTGGGTAADVAALAATELKNLERLEAESEKLEEALAESVTEPEAYAKNEAALKSNETERRRLEKLIPLLKKKQDELEGEERKTGGLAKFKKAQALNTVAAELQRTVYMKAAQMVAAVAALDKYAQDQKGAAIEEVKRAGAAVPSFKDVREIIGDSNPFVKYYRGKPLHTVVALGNPLNRDKPLFRPAGEHASILPATPFEYPVAAWAERLLKAADPGAELQQILTENPLPDEYFTQPPFVDPATRSQPIVHTTVGRNSGTSWVEDHGKAHQRSAPPPAFADEGLDRIESNAAKGVVLDTDLPA